MKKIISLFVMFTIMFSMINSASAGETESMRALSDEKWKLGRYCGKLEDSLSCNWECYLSYAKKFSENYLSEVELKTDQEIEKGWSYQEYIDFSIPWAVYGILKYEKKKMKLMQDFSNYLVSPLPKLEEFDQDRILGQACIEKNNNNVNCLKSAKKCLLLTFQAKLKTVAEHAEIEKLSSRIKMIESDITYDEKIIKMLIKPLSLRDILTQEHIQKSFDASDCVDEKFDDIDFKVIDADSDNEYCSAQEFDILEN